MAVLLMAAGAVMTKFFPVREWGIQTLSAVEPGLPQFVIPDIRMLPMKEVVTISLSVAVVIMAETLLAENNFAQKNGYRMMIIRKFCILYGKFPGSIYRLLSY